MCCIIVRCLTKKIPIPHQQFKFKPVKGWRLTQGQILRTRKNSKRTGKKIGRKSKNTWEQICYGPVPIGRANIGSWLGGKTFVFCIVCNKRPKTSLKNNKKASLLAMFALPVQRDLNWRGKSPSQWLKKKRWKMLWNFESCSNGSIFQEVPSFLIRRTTIKGCRKNGSTLNLANVFWWELSKTEAETFSSVQFLSNGPDKHGEQTRHLVVLCVRAHQIDL